MDESSPRLFVGQHPWQRENAERHGPALRALADRLLALGGHTVIVPPDRPELVGPELGRLLDEGRADDGAAALLEPGEPSECHANVVALWRGGRGSIRTGYALSDGRWRSHSWIEAPDGTLVETTEPRDLYFGITLDEDEATAFAASV